VGSYTNAESRDCLSAPPGSYAEEINNYGALVHLLPHAPADDEEPVGTSFLSFIGNPTGTPPKPNSLRIGLITMHSSRIPAASCQRISQESATQHHSGGEFLHKFYTQTAGSFTPLQQALARAGWIYAGKLNTASPTGIPTAMIRSRRPASATSTLLTTDGYWNQCGRYLPQTPAAKTIGNLDASPRVSLARPWSTALRP